MRDKIRVLFVSSGNSKTFTVAPFIKSQGDSLVAHGVSITYFPIKGKGINGYLKAVKQLKNWLSYNEVDIIHAHYGLCGISSYLARKKQPLIVSLMGDDLLGSRDKNGRITHYSKIISFIIKFAAYYLNDITIVKSKEMINKLSNNCQKYLIPNGVNISTFFPIPQLKAQKILNWDEDKLHVIFLSNPNRHEKNYLLTYESVELLKNLGSNLLLHVIYEKQNSDLNYYYNAANVLVLSSFHEGSPNVVKEAMACNCPIVATNVGDVKWLLGNTEGCFITDFSVDSFAAGITNALEFSKNGNRTNGRERIVSLGIDTDTIAKRIVDIYKKS